MYNVLSDSTLMGLTKRQLIEQIRIAEHNWFAANEIIKQQYENTKDWEPVKHGHWIQGYDDSDIPIDFDCSICNMANDWESDFCPNCGAKMGGNCNECN